jgi:hypothetical protein
MRSFFENRRLIVLLAALALGALTILAISLNGVPFREAERFDRGTEAVPPPVASINQIQTEMPIWKQFVALTLLFLLSILVLMLISPKWRKRLLVMLVRMLVWAVGIYILFTNPVFSEMLSGIVGRNALRPKDNVSPNESLTPMPVFEPPQVSSTFSYLLSFVFALLLLAVVWGLYGGWKKYMLLNTRKPLADIAQIARSSLDDLSAGRNSSDVIINCYLRMSDVVSSKRHLQREIAMTPLEFAEHLEQAGLPSDAVRRLTRLFEGVRYGDRKSPPKDVNEAVSCLQTILHYCGEPV